MLGVRDFVKMPLQQLVYKADITPALCPGVVVRTKDDEARPAHSTASVCGFLVHKRRMMGMAPGSWED